MLHPAYEFRFSMCGEYQLKRVAVVVEKDLEGRVIVERRTDLVDHSYPQVLDIWKLDT